MLVCDSSSSTSYGNGLTVIGRSKPTLMPCWRAALHSGECHASCRTEAYYHEIGIIQEIFFVPDFILLDFLPAFEHAQVGNFFFDGVDIDGTENAPFATDGAIGGPFPILAFDGLHFGQFGRFHHLADGAVSDDHACGAVAFREVEGKHRHVDGFLYGRGRQHDRVVVPMSAAMHGLVVVTLRGGDISQARVRRASR